ncbi:RBBP9/YdeN family alpha/beta hydrolase [Azonexus sp.]|uniref:RBBP9/YdeN family alpha/beta hydrolase n=1 Tax=Azonexus sp. TaxID=1872668 RepID=UPI0035AF8DC0
MPTLLTFPGIGNSGPEHWQSCWERANPDFVRIAQRDWDNPVCSEWTSVLESTVLRLGPSVVVVAHSLGCLAVAHWATLPHAPIRAALLVAVPDPDSAAFPVEASGFSPLPMQPFSFPSIVVASSDDPYSSPEHAAVCAAAWGSRLVEISAAGHINAASNLGDWPAGMALLQQLCA